MPVAGISRPAESEKRRALRTNLFVMAVLHGRSGPGPVKVRNLSSDGALVEGRGLPEPGTQVRLCRAALSVDGEIVWCEDERAGVRFTSSVNVGDWLRHGPTAGQYRVDELVHRLKISGLASPAASAGDTLASEAPSSAELHRLREAIESLAEDLASDPAVVERHSLKLQTLDIAAQAFLRLAAARS